MIALDRHTIGTDGVRKRMTALHEILEIEVIAFFPTDPEEVVEHAHPINNINFIQFR